MATIKVTTELMNALLSAETQRRQEAEAYFHSIPLNERVSGLVLQIQTQNHLAAVLLRRDILRMADTQAVESLLDPLLASFLAGHSSVERIAIGHCVAEVCGTVALLSPSPQKKEEVMSRILNTISDSVANGDIPSLRMLAAMAERAPAVFTRTAVPSLESLTKQNPCGIHPSAKYIVLEALMQVLVQGAIATQQNADSPLLPFRNNSVDTVDSCSQAASLGRNCLPGLAPLLLETMDASPSSTMVILEQWTQAAGQCPSFLAGDKSVLEMVIYLCCKVASKHHQTDMAVALAALQVIATLCAVGDIKRKILSEDQAMRQKLLLGQEQQQGVIALTIHIMTSGIDEDVEGWAASPASLQEEDPWDGDDFSQHAESLLQSFLHNLGGSSLYLVLPMIESLLGPNPDWRTHRSGLAAMEACIVVAPVSFAPHIPIATEAALSLAVSTQPVRVQFQALRLLGILCEINISLDESYSTRILKAFTDAVKSPVSKVSSLASKGIVSFCRGGIETRQQNVVENLPVLLSSLTTGPLSLQVTDQGSSVGIIHALGALACLAETSGEAFVPFYGSVMPGLMNFAQMQPRGNHEINRLIATAIECSTIVGQAIKDDETTRRSYIVEAERIMNVVFPILNSDQGNSELPLDTLLAGCARIATVMGTDYAPFMNVVLPHLLKSATSPPDVSVTSGDESGLDATKLNGIEYDEDLGTESITVATPGKGIQKFTVNTSQIQEKAQAARAVYEHARALGAAFQPHVDSCMNAFASMIAFKFSPEVRSTSAQAVAAIFEAACLSADDSAAQVKNLQLFFPELTKIVSNQIHVEDPSEMESLYALADALSDIFYSVYKRKDTYGRLLASALSVGDAASMVEMIMNSISTCLKRRSEIYGILSGQNGALTGEDEKEECNARLREEEELLTPLVDSCGYIIKLLKESFIPLFEKFVAPVLGPSLTNGDIRARLCGLCLFIDCVEHCCGSEATAKHAQKLVYGILLGIDRNCNAGDLDVLSASIYGVSQICRYAPVTVLQPHLEAIFHHLMLLVNSSTKEEADSPMAYENAVSALAAMVLIGAAPYAGSGIVKPDEVLPLFVNNLPLREDGDEAKICHAGFCDLVERGRISKSLYTAQILQIVGETIAFVSEGEDIASEETCSRLATILAEMQQQIPAEQMNAAFASISVEAQNGINVAMQG